MFKRVIGILLTAALVFTMFPTLVFANTTPDAITEIAQYKLGGESVTIADIPAYVTTYANGTTTSTDGAVIVYIMNHGGKVVGQESDGSILSTYLTGENAGKYVVVTVDFLNNPLAVSPTIDVAMQNLIRNDIWSSKKFMYGNSFVNETAYVLPQGCRLARDVWYYDLLGNGAKGTEEAIVASWNTSAFQTTHGSKIPPCAGNNNEGGWFEATDISQLVKKDGTPIDTNLRLDIVYPSNPKEKTPVFMHSSSWERRSGSGTSAFNIGFGLRGYTTVTYDHEYYPMARDDHYGYYGGAYGTATTNGVKTHTAAARCVKYYADTYGYDATRLSNMGISKASYTALLGHPNPESLEELSDYSSYGYTKGDNYGEQPFLKDINGNDLSGHIQVVFTAMGHGAQYHKRLMTKESSPIVTCCGYYDEFGAWDYWEAQQQTYKDLDLPNLAITMMDLGHNAPLGVDPDLNFLREDSVMDFFDYYINEGSPNLTYIYPVSGSENYDGAKNLKLKFAGEIALSEIENNVTITESETGNEVEGVWTVCNGNTEFDFITDEYESSKTYVVNVPNTIKDSNFSRALEDSYQLTFTMSDNDGLYPVNDAYIISGDTKITGSENTVEISKDKKIGYFEFDMSNVDGIVNTSELWLNIENEASQTLNVYAAKDASWAEGTITSANAPSLDDATKVTTVAVNGAGIYKIDVSDYISTFDGEKVTFIITAEKEPGKKGLTLSFDDLSSLVKASVSDNNPISDTAHYKIGGDPKGVELTSDEDHTTGSGKSLLFKRDSTWDRIKLFNTFGDTELTADDIGDTYKLSFWVKPASDATVSAGLMNSYVPEDSTHPQYAYEKYASSYFGTTENKEAKAGEWTEVVLKYTIGKDNIDGRIQMLTIQTSAGACNLYIDDISVELIATDVSITSKEGRNLAENKFKPKLVITKDVIDPANPVRIENTKYATLAAAVAAVPTDGTLTEIKLDTDITLNEKITVAEGKNIYLNLCGKTIDITGFSEKPVFTVAGKMTVDNGTVKDEYLDSNGVGRAGYVFHVYGNKDAYLEIGSKATVHSYTDYGVFQVGRYDNLDTSVTDELNGTLVICDGAVVTTRWSIVYAYPDGNVTIYGGDFENTSTSNSSLMALRDSSYFSPVRKIYGGTFKTVKTPTDSQYPLKTMTPKSIYGGTFGDKRNLDACLAYGYEYVDNGDGTYTVVSKKVWNAPMVDFSSSDDVLITTYSYDNTTWHGSSENQIKYMEDGYARVFNEIGAWNSNARIGFTTKPDTVNDDNELYMVCKIQIHPGTVKTRYRLGYKTDTSTSCANVFLVDEDSEGKLIGYKGATSTIDGSVSIGEISDYYGDKWVDCVAVIDLNTASTNAPVTIYMNDIKGTGSLHPDIATRARSGELLGIFMQNEEKGVGTTYIDNAGVYTIKKSELIPLKVSVDGLKVSTSNEVMVANLTNASDSSLSVIKANGQYLPIDAIKAEKGGLAFTISEEALSYGDNEIDLSEVKDIFGQSIEGENTFTITKDMDSVIVTSTSIGAFYDDSKGTDTKTARFFVALDSLDYAEAGFEVEATVNGETYTWKLSLEEVYKQVIANNIVYVPEENKFILTGAIGDIPATIMDVVQFNVQMYTTDFEGVTVKSNAVVIK